MLSRLKGQHRVLALLRSIASSAFYSVPTLHIMVFAYVETGQVLAVGVKGGVVVRHELLCQAGKVRKSTQCQGWSLDSLAMFWKSAVNHVSKTIA